MGTIKKFEDLEIWQKARILAHDINNVAENSDLKRNFKLYNQIDGSCGSIMDNIAEGFERDGNREFIQFLSIAKGSCGETRSQLYRVYDRKFIDEESFNLLRNQCLDVSKGIAGFMNYLSNCEIKGNKFK